MGTSAQLLDKLIKENLLSLPADLKHNAEKGATTGTVTLAFPYNQGIIMGADRQTSCGGKIWRTNSRKIRQVGKFSAVAGCGTVTMIQLIPEIYEKIIRRMEWELDEELALGIRTTIFWDLMRSIAHQLNFDAMAAFIFAGLDPKRKTGALLDFGPDGSKFGPEKHHLTSGSGYAEADASLIEYFARATPGKTDLETASRAAIKAIWRAGQKDLYVGDPRTQGATLAVIDGKTGFRFLSDEKVNKLIKEVCK
ncbi:MAG: hypothetical protein Q7S36_01910 [Candidatus Liptonbacteria bacterium]|nr:hypothetical protein [Candidatus Liptonbacteria bacterium]